MNTIEAGSIKAALRDLGLKSPTHFYQLPPQTLIEQTLLRQLGDLSSTGALCIQTGEFTGRCPQDKFIVKDQITAHAVDWKNFNIPINEKRFLQLRRKLTAYLSTKPEIWVRDCVACANPAYQLKIRVINEDPYSNLFAYNMFLRPDSAQVESFQPDWHILQAPGFVADPILDGTRSPHFAIISFAHKTIIIGGTGYTGEIKKAIFTVLNFLMPTHYNVLSMHCAANMGKEGDVALFFGLSGTGKTTLSADPSRQLIGDDEHGWAEDGIFNFEGGCYAKCINLSPKNEPEIYNAIGSGALLENTMFFNGSSVVDFFNNSITENTRVSYPLHHISNALERSVGGHPQNIFFLTCDANGVLPPISRLTPQQAMYQFLSGYTARVAGTETGVAEPKSTFSTCFGAPFMPLHPVRYANMLGKKLQEHNATVWLVNTGWSGGPYGTGNRIPLVYTRALINAVLSGTIKNVPYQKLEVFGFEFPTVCQGVPGEILNPRNTWLNKDAYDEKLRALANEFVHNFHKFSPEENNEIKFCSSLI
jgi:phosphoenolpyruvate carboxykinase (ATP)